MVLNIFPMSGFDNPYKKKKYKRTTKPIKPRNAYYYAIIEFHGYKDELMFYSKTGRHVYHTITDRKVSKSIKKISTFKAKKLYYTYLCKKAKQRKLKKKLMKQKKKGR